ncbi:MAG: hypothetical protein K2J04_12215 [Lachnospiraceae bacterium]|nr:hypothetical protein [Lachnospiraceae bacterium]
MDKIQECAVHFLNLVNTTSYVFHLANKDVRVVSLNFMPEDFHHLAGLQYLTDIMIPRNKKKRYHGFWIKINQSRMNICPKASSIKENLMRKRI